MKVIEIRKNGTKRVYTVNNEPSKTDQSQAKECDVNHIMKKYMKTGQITHLAKVRGTYADVSAIPDLNEALSIVKQADESFSSLPAQVRKRFGNDPSQLLEFLKDPKNDEEAIQLGLKESRQKSDNTPGDIPPPKKEVKNDGASS